MKSLSIWQLLFGLIMLVCAARPWWLPKSLILTQHELTAEQNWAFSQWHLSKKPLAQLPVTALEQRFASGFPGAIARFSDGQTVWVVRHVTQSTRLLHSAVDCYRGLGYQVSAPHVVQRANYQRWRCFTAARGQALQVCERIFDGQQREWTDVSAWYWETFLSSGQHAWWAVTEVNRIEGTNRYE